METPLKVGDSAIMTTSLGHKYSILILEVLEKGGYLCRRDGVWADRSSTPNFLIRGDYIFDPSHLKEPFEFTGKGWGFLNYRAPEAGDDEKRAIWDSLIKKHEEAIAAQWLRYAHIKKGATVECYEWNSWTGERFLQFVGKITYIKKDFTFYANDKEGNHRQGRFEQLRVIEDDPSIPVASIAALCREAAEELVGVAKH
jgi:hypothetical protein